MADQAARLPAAADAVTDFDTAEERWAGGAGFRYNIARLFNRHSGIDFARGPEEWAVYLQFGGSWN